MSPSRLMPERATCERCSDEVPMTRAERSARVGPDGSFLCDRCKQRPLRMRVIHVRPNAR